jgi:hypothetical protein
VYDQFLSTPSAVSLAARGAREGYPIAPGNKLVVDDFWSEYAKDNKTANEKFAEKYVELIGKVRTVVSDSKKNAVILETASEKYGVECNFVTKGDIVGLQAGAQITIQGEVTSRAKPEDNVVLQVCKVRK